MHTHTQSLTHIPLNTYPGHSSGSTTPFGTHPPPLPPHPLPPPPPSPCPPPAPRSSLRRQLVPRRRALCRPTLVSGIACGQSGRVEGVPTTLRSSCGRPCGVPPPIAEERRTPREKRPPPGSLHGSRVSSQSTVSAAQWAPGLRASRTFSRDTSAHVLAGYDILHRAV